jgi:hypothetical protein
MAHSIDSGISLVPNSKLLIETDDSETELSELRKVLLCNPCFILLLLYICFILKQGSLSESGDFVSESGSSD